MSLESSARMAGFALAHAAWSVSQMAAGEELTPFVMVDDEGAREMMRFEAATHADAVEEGKAAVRRLRERVDLWAFARDGLLRVRGSDSAQHALTVEFGGRGDAATHAVVQPYEPAASAEGFRIAGEPMVLRDWEIVGSDDAEPVVRAIRGGIREHGAAAALFDA
jgi:hypothetical protein